ncbi:MAG: transcription antitermination protein NusB [Candidatus Binatota bacterium]|nr:transcription antitermination protein NusB [Candidatus Binatota bacterium]
MGLRRKAREIAVQALYRIDVTGDESIAAFELLWDHFDAPREAKAFAAELVQGVRSERERIDALIAQALENWSLGRLSRVDVNVLRVATWELLHPAAVPPSGAINEAIEIARRFGGDEARQFVNGVLDEIAGILGVRPRTADEPADERRS